MLTGHHRISLRRRFPDATIEDTDDRVALVFPDGSLVFGYRIVGQWCVSVSVAQAVPLPVLDAVIDARDELRRMLC